ncbi:hypothetical protein [Lunatibacter salilacus]|uniref:hypothetical protein n=1 Tax=Lunatibacter salilacus TaxID=2483804 RepID=UPI00131D5DE2|nr:hypothetical protein [Lunatibacter salilacus]
MTNSLLTCTPGFEQTTYLSIRYQTTSNSEVSNARIFADLKVGEETRFLNYFFGILPAASDLSRVLTLDNFPLSWTCGEEVSLNNPLLSWTTSGSADLSEDYACNSYPTAQCQFQSNIVVDAPLAVQFDYFYSCPENGETPVTFSSTTNGGRGPYQYNWTFTNASLSDFTEPDPVLNFYGRGTATLTVTDANGTVNTYHADLDIPTAIDFDPEIIHQTEEDSPNGSITLEMNTLSALSFSWIGPNGFVSDEQNIYGLSEGTYVLTITDAFGCSEVMDFEIFYFITLPLLRDDLNASLKENNQAVKLTWSRNSGIGTGYFKVERALQNTDAFTVVGQLPVTEWNTETLNYHFADSSLSKFDRIIYYRIKFVPEFGKSTYTSTIKVDIPLVQSDKKWSAFPNPFEDKVRLKYFGNALPLGELIKIKIYSPSMTYTNQFVTKENHVDLGTIVSSAPKGLLIVEINYLDKVEIVKVLKK